MPNFSICNDGILPSSCSIDRSST